MAWPCSSRSTTPNYRMLLSLFDPALELLKTLPRMDMPGAERKCEALES